MGDTLVVVAWYHVYMDHTTHDGDESQWMGTMIVVKWNATTQTIDIINDVNDIDDDCIILWVN